MLRSVLALALAASAANALTLNARLPARTAPASRHPARVSTLKLNEHDDESEPVAAAFLESRQTHLKDVDEYRSMYKRSVEDPSGFWGDIASTFHWETKWDDVVDSNFAPSNGKVFSSWFKGGKTNLCYNALDRHVEAGHGDQVAFHYEANDESEEMRSWTYAEVLDEVQRLSNLLKERGVQKGERGMRFSSCPDPHAPAP